MVNIFDDLMDRMMVWIDDLLGFAKTEAELLELLANVFERAREVGLKFNPTKCTIFARELVWCGKIYSGNGIRHDPERIAALTSMPEPKTVKDLQQLMWAVGWMRTTIPDYPYIIEPLQEVVGRANEELKRTKSTFEKLRAVLVEHVQLAYPKKDFQTCLFTDASEFAWSAVVTQIPMEDIELPISEQRHEPLAFHGKRFDNTQLRWPIIEKEAAAIVQATTRGDFLL
ncbi:hypothetical protein PBRA_008747 [Plasmodiophora brassicae]|uniref:Reverse transcriptase domain-containing protein n=1 Tax=Plasmodiophora brassicae TaxID=37360 RepID=A0A0G4J2M7_PLABS|nr:hypothetical protein PBRA_008747 [Plasmodiophora brassicae]